MSTRIICAVLPTAGGGGVLLEEDARRENRPCCGRRRQGRLGSVPSTGSTGRRIERNAEMDILKGIRPADYVLTAAWSRSPRCSAS
jgi:hypothetical protein